MSGPDANKPCVFPFQFEGVAYETCTLAASTENKPWCSTLVDDAGNHVTGQGSYGNCGPQCPAPSKKLGDIDNLSQSLNGKDCQVIEKASGQTKRCQFPFIYKDETFYGCITLDETGGKAWCPTKTDPIDYAVDRIGQFYGFCPEALCPTEETGLKQIEQQTENNEGELVMYI